MDDFTQSTKRAGVEVLTKHFRRRLERFYHQQVNPINLLDLVGHSLPFGHQVEYQRYVNAMKSTYSFLQSTGAKYWYTLIPTGLEDFAAIQRWLVVDNPLAIAEQLHQREREQRLAAEQARQTEQRTHLERMQAAAKRAMGSLWSTLETQPATSWRTFYKEQATYGKLPEPTKSETGSWVHALLIASEDEPPVFTDFAVLGIDCPGMSLIETGHGACCLNGK